LLLRTNDSFHLACFLHSLSSQHLSVWCQSTDRVLDRVKNYLEETNVQLGATYNVAKQSTESYDKGQEAAAKFMGAENDEVGMQTPSASSIQAIVPMLWKPGLIDWYMQ